MPNRFHEARAATLSLAATLAIAIAPQALRAETLLRLDDYDIDKLQVSGFELPRKASIEIEAVGTRPRWGGFSAYAWILNSATRAVVWSQDDTGSSRVDGNRLLRSSKDELDLEPGRYELYAWAGSSWSANGVRIRVIDFGDWHDKDQDDDHDGGHWRPTNSTRELRRAARDCWVEVRAKDLAKSDVRSFEPTGDWPGAIFHATQLGDHAFVQAGLTVDRPVDVRVYSVCEFPRNWDDACDGGWIINAATRERVWQVRRRDTEPGGGSEKNRLVDEQLHLERGDYVLYYGTDDSHSADEWNSNPPYDPLNWGITLLPGKNFDASAVHVNEKYQRGEPLLALTQVRDQEDTDRAFHLAKAGEVQILALGEYDERQDEFADHGWISRPGDRDVVWEMTLRNTEHAGGASKNRMFDGSVKLAAGDYVLHYESDDSHSYRDWNADKPYEPDAWGVSLYPGAGLTGADFKTVVLAEAAQPTNALVSLVGIGDNEHERDTFKLDRTSSIHIYALGEGDRDRMYDYAWIETRDTGKTVWEMTWRNTSHAGGARKNRVFDEDLKLEAGTYEVHYETDGSHSYPDWNASRPRDPRSWGITVSLAEPK